MVLGGGVGGGGGVGWGGLGRSDIYSGFSSPGSAMRYTTGLLLQLSHVHVLVLDSGPHTMAM